MDTATQFCIGVLFLVILGEGALLCYFARLLACANERIALTSETNILASKATDPRVLAEALNQRDAARHDNQMLKKELSHSMPLAQNLQRDDENAIVADGTMYIGGLALDPIKR